MPSLAFLQFVLFILWFVPPVAAVVPTFVFFLPIIIVLTLFGALCVFGGILGLIGVRLGRR